MTHPVPVFAPASQTHAVLIAAAQQAGGPLVAFDTSTDLTSLAYADPEHGVHELHFDAPARPCAVLIEGLRTLSASCGRRIDAIGALVVGCGPGSFTGLRVGLATAKGLSLGAALPLYGASSLVMMAAEAGPGLVLALQDARRGELFAGLYDIDATGSAQVILADTAIGCDLLAPCVQKLCAARRIDCAKLRISGFEAHKLADAWGAQACHSRPRALWGLIASLDSIGQHRSVDAAALIPQYLRLSEPERQQLARATQAAQAARVAPPSG